MSSNEIGDIFAPILSTFIMFIICVIIMLHSFGVVKFKDVKQDLEYFEIGKIYDTPTSNPTSIWNPPPLRDPPVPPPLRVKTKVPRFKPIKVAKKKKTNTTKTTTVSNLEKDCVLALLAIGVKKSTAKIEVKDFFSTNSVDSVQEFLRVYLKK